MQKAFLEAGEIVGTHGVRGELRVNPWCDAPEFLKNFKRLYLSADGTAELAVLSARVHKNVVLLVLDTVDTMEKAQALRGKTVYIRREDAPLKAGNWFIQDLIGCRVLDADTNALYGEITEISETGANDVWHITDANGNTTLIPAIPSVVINADTENSVVQIRPLAGLFDGREQVVRDED